MQKKQPKKKLKKSLNKDAIAVGRNLREIRKRRGYSQQYIGRVLEVSFQQIQKYESGQNRLPIEKLYQLKHIYDVSYFYFFDGLAYESAPLEIEQQSGEYIDEISLKIKALKDPILKEKICKIIETLLL